jgi:spore coat polysaccharide biosynthesis predicted glycosyltransferase SpsG/RimJ/RimL family protein N-acetyltransferase
VRIEEPHPGWLENDPDWVVVDGYRFQAAQQETRRRGLRLLAIADHGAGATADATIVLDQNLDADATAYGGDTSLIGARYTLLRREFTQLAEWRRAVPRECRKLLVVFGGFPSSLGAQFADQVVKRAELRSFVVDHLVAREDVASAMMTADLALSAAGSTAWELCCTGLPAVVLAAAPNQVPVARALAAHGAAIDAGVLERARPSQVAKVLADLARSPAKRAAMSEIGRSLFDGKGARRVASRLRAELLTLRQASEEDCRELWLWANDPVVRAQSFSPDPISWEAHCQWFFARVRNPLCRTYLAAEPSGELVGQIRFDRTSGTAEIGVSVAAHARGQGWGAALIEAGVRRVLQDDRQVCFIVARVKVENSVSARSFESAGFEFEGQGSDDRGKWLRYARRR